MVRIVLNPSRSSTFALDSLPQRSSSLESDGFDSAGWQSVVGHFGFQGEPDKELRKIPESAWYRFQRITEENKNTLLAITRHPIVTSAQITISTMHRLCIDDLSTQRTDLSNSFLWRSSVYELNRNIDMHKNVKSCFAVIYIPFYALQCARQKRVLEKWLSRKEPMDQLFFDI